MTDASHPRRAPPSPWRIVTLDEHVRPTDSQPAAMRRRWRALARLLRSEDPDQAHARAETELRSLPNVRLEHLAPALDWSAAAEALASFLRDESARPPDASHARVRVLVCPPHCAHEQILAHWAARHGARILDLPDEADVLADTPRWLESLPPPPTDDRDARPWVLPRLERCFLRHAQGLTLLRSFLAAAFSGRLGPGLIGCDSWAFAYVQRIWPLPAGVALTLQGFDGSALAEHFIRPFCSGVHAVEFRSARSGKPLLPEPDSDGEDRDAAIAPELRQLAAHVRGNPGLAWHYWRERLRSAPQAQPAQDGESGTAPSAADTASRGMTLGEDVVWLGEDIAPPGLPADSGDDHAFIFHALLIHRSLPTALLAHLLPTPEPRLQSLLLRLEALGLVARDGGGEAARWQVPPLAYLTVREFLRSRSYLTDAF